MNLFAALAAIVAGVWWVCALAGVAAGFPFLPLFLCLLAAHFAIAASIPLRRP